MGSPAIEPQRILAGRYRLEERLGVGGMGAIWRAEHLLLQAPVAVKLINREALRDDDTLGRFLREAKAAAALRSPHVVQILDYGVDDSTPFIVMELLEGETLAQRVKRLKRLAPVDTVRIVAHIGRAVARAHEAGIVHRDLKPENVFLVQNEDEEIAKVLDFGVAKIEPGVLGPEPTHTRTGSVLGTPYYMSPEQAQGNKAVDHRSDLWSLGVIAFECLTGRRPFYSEGLGDLVLQICVRDVPLPSDYAAVPLGFDAWFARAMMREPELRFQSAREMTDALREALGVENREAVTQPEIVMSSGAFEARDGALVGPRGARERDGNAPTVEFAPDPLERLASSSVHALPVPERSGVTSIFVVAALALTLGVGGGLYALRRLQPARFEPSPQARALPAPEPPRPVETLSDASGKPSPSSAPNVSTSAAAGAAAAAPSAASALPSAINAPRVAAPAPRPAADTTATDPAPASRGDADAAWVKPAWAIPDEEPRRVPEVADDETAP